MESGSPQLTYNSLNVSSTTQEARVSENYKPTLSFTLGKAKRELDLA